MTSWKVGASFPAVSMARHMINAQLSPLAVGVDSQDIIDDLMKFKERALSVPHHEDPAQIHAERPGNETPV